MTMKRLSVFGFAIFLGALIPQLAIAEAKGGKHKEPIEQARIVGRTAVVEVIERANGAEERRVVFTMALADDDRASLVEVYDGGADYRVSLRRASAAAGTAVVQLDLRRIQHRQRGPTHETQVSMSSRVAVDRRVVLGRIERSAGGVIEVALTLR